MASRCAVAAFHLAPAPAQPHLQPAEWPATVRWLVRTQRRCGFAGRTYKLPDACYGFWCDTVHSLFTLPHFTGS
ncbi:hypothetical protein V8E53_002299 [Lactarius tabidus]